MNLRGVRKVKITYNPSALKCPGEGVTLEPDLPLRPVFLPVLFIWTVLARGAGWNLKIFCSESAYHDPAQPERGLGEERRLRWRHIHSPVPGFPGGPYPVHRRPHEMPSTMELLSLSVP